MKKSNLRLIARQWAKGLLQDVDHTPYFEEHFTKKDAIYIQGQLYKIGDRITRDKGTIDIPEIISNYPDKNNS